MSAGSASRKQSNLRNKRSNYADAQHLSAKFTSRFVFDRAPQPSLALGTNNSAISAIGNVYSFEQIFARELGGIAQPNDVFNAISTSGNSPNILAAVQAAKNLSLHQISRTGQTGGKLADQCECLRVLSTETTRIQECDILVGHLLCELVEQQFFGGTQ